jgi:hypothetical protein
MLSQWPDSIREPLLEYHLKNWRKSPLEGKNLKSELYDEVRLGGDMPDVPLIVLIAMGIDLFMALFIPEGFLREVNDAKCVVYTDFARSLPQGEHRILEDAGHSTIHTDRPDAVIQGSRPGQQADNEMHGYGCPCRAESGSCRRPYCPSHHG